MNAAAHLPAPARWRMASEWRALGEFGTSLSVWPLLLATAARGDGHPVLVIPGFLASDASTFLMRRFLARKGFAPYGWGLGRSLGGIRRTRAALAERLETIAAQSGRQVSIVGWSLGGVMARDLAQTHPGLVRYVVGMASPLSRDLRSANTGKLYARLAHDDVDPSGAFEGELTREFDGLAGDLACPSTAMYSRSDGIVNWRTCLIRENDRAENLEVAWASHTGFGINAAALYALADRLAQPEATFTRFAPHGPFAIAYGSERRTR